MKASLSTFSQNVPVVGQLIPIEYNTTNPSDIRSPSLDGKSTAIILAAIGILAAGSSFILTRTKNRLSSI